jgi:hypothetical protein
MPLSVPAARREAHHRSIEMKTFARDDGLYDAEARLTDRKPFDFVRPSSTRPVPAGEPLHDLWIRMTLDGEYTVCAVEAASDITPWGICNQAEETLQVLVGHRIARGWSALVKEKLRGAASCTHLMEMLIPMATTALQGIRGLHPQRARGMGADGTPLKLDSCFAYARTREVVKMLWPDHYRPPDKS